MTFPGNVFNSRWGLRIKFFFSESVDLTKLFGYLHFIHKSPIHLSFIDILFLSKISYMSPNPGSEDISLKLRL